MYVAGVTMQFSGRRRKLLSNPQNELYGHCLQFYSQPPTENISLAEFETFAVERLKRKDPSNACVSHAFVKRSNSIVSFGKIAVLYLYFS